MPFVNPITSAMLTPPATPPGPVRIVSAPANVSPDRTPRLSVPQVAVMEPSTLQANWSPPVPLKTCPLCHNDAQVPPLPSTVQTPAVAHSAPRAITPPASALLPMRPASADARPSFSSFSLSLGACRGNTYTVRSPHKGPCFVTTPRNCAAATPEIRQSADPAKALGVLQDAWAQLSMLSYDDSARTPDPQRLRQVCKVLLSVVNQMEDPMQRRVFLELFLVTFKDYARLYDPHLKASNGPQTLPRISEEQLSNLVPFFSVAQNLRETAKDAILRKLELEAKVSGAVLDQATMEERQVIEEVKLKEELRHARLLADTFQARSVELEKVRIDLEEQLRQSQLERSKEDLQRRKLTNEVKRLRADAEVAKAAKAAVEAERQRQTAAITSRRSAPVITRPDSARSRTGTVHSVQSTSSFGRAPRLDPFGSGRSTTTVEASPRNQGPGREVQPRRVSPRRPSDLSQVKEPEPSLPDEANSDSAPRESERSLPARSAKGSGRGPSRAAVPGARTSRSELGATPT
eukprot:s4125_g4.t1